MNLYNRKSLISAAPEGKPEPSFKASITQWLYFIIVILLVGYLLYLLIKPYYIVQAQGLVDIEVRDVLAERDGVLMQLNVQRGQSVKQGDLLATFVPQKRCEAERDSVLDKLAFDMQLLGNDIKALQQEKSVVAAIPSANVGMQRALEVNASLFKTQQKQQQDQQQALDKLNIEIKKEQQRLALMSARHDQLLAEKRAQTVSEACLATPVFAAEDGDITEIRVLQHAFAAKGMPILKYTPTDALARVVFLADADLYPSFAQQTQLMVTFPDGVESLARVERIESVASKVSGNLNDLLSQDKVALRMILLPVDTSHNALWKKYDRLPVSVRGLR